MNKSESVKELALSAPPVSVAGLSLAGVSLQDWVLVATLVWLGIQITHFGWCRWKDWRE